MKTREVASTLQYHLERMRDRCARAAERGGAYAVAADIRSLSVEVKIMRPETAVTKPETVTEHTIIAGQGLHPDTDEIIDRRRLERIDLHAIGIGVTSNGTILRDVKRCP